MTNPCKTDPAIVAVHAANAARRALDKAVDLGHHSDDDFKPYHSAADAADMALLATHADTPRGFAELALYCAEHVIGCEVGVGKSFDDVKAAEGPLGPMVYVAHIAREAAAMIESGIIDGEQPETVRGVPRDLMGRISDMEDAVIAIEGAQGIIEAVMMYGSNEAQGALMPVIKRLGENAETLRDQYYGLFNEATGKGEAS